MMEYKKNTKLYKKSAFSRRSFDGAKRFRKVRFGRISTHAMRYTSPSRRKITQNIHRTSEHRERFLTVASKKLWTYFLERGKSISFWCIKRFIIKQNTRGMQCGSVSAPSLPLSQKTVAQKKRIPQIFKRRKLGHAIDPRRYVYSPSLSSPFKKNYKKQTKVRIQIAFLEIFRNIQKGKFPIRKIRLKKLSFSFGVSILLLAFFINSVFYPHPVYSATYNWITTTQAEFEAGDETGVDTTTSPDDVILDVQTQNYNDTIDTEVYKDTVNDTALWDTTSEQVEIPLEYADTLFDKVKEAWGVTQSIRSSVLVGDELYIGVSEGQFFVYDVSTSTAADITDKIDSFWSETISSLTYDSSNNDVYLVGSQTFAKYDLDTETATNLTSKVSTIFGSSNMSAIEYDSTNSMIYIGGQSAKFADYDPSLDTATDLSSKISSFWGTNYVYTLTFDTTNSEVYLAGSAGKFAKYDPVGASATDLTSRISSFWSTNFIYSITYNSTDDTVYLGGTNGRFGVYDISGDTGTNLWSRISSFWVPVSTFSLEYDSVDNEVYLGGQLGQLAKYDPVADSATDLKSKISSFWGNENIFSITFDATNDEVYLGGSIGLFGDYLKSSDTAVDLSQKLFSLWDKRSYNIQTLAANSIDGEVYLSGYTGRMAVYDFSTDTVTDLTSKISSFWGGDTIDASAFDSSNKVIYIAGGSGKFAKYDISTDTATDLTSRISSFWSSDTIKAMTYDSSATSIYIAGVNGKFARYDIGLDTATDLKSRISSFIGSRNLYALTFDSSNVEIYLGGQGGEFAKYDPALDTATDLRSRISSFWSTSQVNALAYESTRQEIYIGGQGGSFAKYDPGLDTATDISSSISLFWIASHVNSITYNPVRDIIYLVGNAGNFASYDPLAGTAIDLESWTDPFFESRDIYSVIYNPVDTNLYMGSVDGKFAYYSRADQATARSLEVDTIGSHVLTATPTFSDTVPLNTTVTYYLSADGGSNWEAVTSGVEHTFTVTGDDLRWRADMVTIDDSITPSIQDVDIDYTAYYETGTIANLKKDAGGVASWVSITWNETTPAATDVKFRTRSADTEASLALQPWSGYILNTGDTISSGDERWLEVEATLETTGVQTPTLNDFTIVYSINAPPDITNVTASQDSNGMVQIQYDVRDVDTNGGTFNPGEVDITFQYWDGGTWQECTTTTGEERKAVNTGDPLQYTTYTGTWDPTIDFDDQYMADAEIRVTANDNEAVYYIGTGDSPDYILDTTDPVTSPLIIDASDDPADITISASDDSAMEMKIGLANDLSDASWEPYAASKQLTFLEDPEIVYAQFRDAYGNTSAIINETTPDTPIAVMVRDTSNMDSVPQQFRLFVAWQEVAEPPLGFDSYTVWRSEDQISWTPIGTENDRVINYYGDNTAVFDTPYYYRITTTDSSGNVSFKSDEVTDKADGLQTDPNPPTISNVADSSIGTTQVTVTWDTNELATSTVGFSTSQGVFTSEIGVPTMKDDASGVGEHQVVLTGLTPNTTYYYQAISVDDDDNTVMDDDGGNGYSFTTLPGPAISNVLVPSINNNDATITWDTTTNSDTFVVYSDTVNLGALVNPIEVGDSSTLGTSHSQIVLGLTSNTTYYFYVKSTDGSGNTAIDNNGGGFFQFITTQAVDVTPPVISAVDAPHVSHNSATIEWLTDEEADSKVEYSTISGAPYALSSSRAVYDETHYIILTGLQANRQYYYRVVSKDINTNESTSLEYTFTTAQLPGFRDGPNISNVSSSSVGTTQATITWDTDELSTSIVEYSTTQAVFTSAQGDTLMRDSVAGAGEHQVLLTGLVPNTTYYYQAKSIDADEDIGADANGGNGYSFTTLPGPAISNVQVPVINENDATITWDTTTNSDTFVVYSDTINLGSLVNPIEIGDSTISDTSHSQYIFDLTYGATYYFKVHSTDADDNRAVDDNGGSFYQFTTATDVTPPVISAVDAPHVSHNQATIYWETNEGATSMVQYSTSSGGPYVDSSVTGTYDETHYVILSGLIANTPYFYRVISEDISTNSSTSLEYTFTTDQLPGFRDGPNISSVVSSSLGTTQATITWDTDELSTSIVGYSTVQADFSSEQGNTLMRDSAAGVGEHQAVLVGLTPNTTYYYQAKSIDADEDIGVDADTGNGYSFTTLPGPAISNIQIPNINDNDATLTWDTTTNSDTFVVYSDTVNLGALVNPIEMGDSSVSDTSHSQMIIALTSNTTYYFEVRSKDADGNMAIDNNAGNFYNFTTTQSVDVTPPVISAVDAPHVSHNQATIYWLTDEEANSLVQYSQVPGGPYLDSPLAAVYDESHYIILSGLVANTPYFYRVVSEDISGNPATSAEYTFTTDQLPGFRDGPDISNVVSSSFGTTQATITWDTDELSTSIVGYSTVQADFSDERGVIDMRDSVAGAGEHQVVLTGLTPDTTYYYQVKSIDSDQDIGTDSDGGLGYSFTTLPGPAISNVVLSAVSQDDATITWNTSINADSFITYSDTINLGALVNSIDIGDATVSDTSHSQRIFELLPNTDYYFSVKSLDADGNLAIDDNAGNFFQFTTSTGDVTAPVISDVDDRLLTNTDAAVYWLTDEGATSMVQYSETSGGPYTDSPITATYDESHYIILNTLSPDAEYFYRVVSEDLSSNAQISAEYSFTTLQDPEFQHPPLSSITNVADPPNIITDTKAVITFQTDQPARCIIEYGTQSGNYTEVPVSESLYNEEHSIHLPGLIFETTYYYNILCEDNLTTVVTDGEYSFATLEEQQGVGSDGSGSGEDTTAPDITNIKVGDDTGESVTITWDTDEDANSLVRYGPTTDYGSMAGDDTVNSDSDNFTQDHSVIVKNLVPDTKYYFIVISYDAAGNINESSQESFTTSSGTSSISSVNVTSTRLGEAIITWKTKEDTTSIIEYGLTEDYGSIQELGSYVDTHEITLTGLELSETYHFRVKGKDQDGNVYASSDVTFQPKSPPQITNVGIQDVTDHTALVVFATNVPTDALVTFQDRGDTTNSGSQGNPSLIQQHTLELTNLKPGTLYDVTIVVQDESGNEAEYLDQSFTTVIDEQAPEIVQIQTDVALTQGEKVQAIISWITDEPSTTALVYWQGARENSKEVKITEDLTTSHVAVITNFSSGAVYYFQTKSVDEVGNEAFSPEHAVLTPRRKENIIQIIINNFQDIFSWTQ